MTPESVLPGLSQGSCLFWARTVKRQQPGIIEHTIAFWEKRTGQEVCREEARQMVTNIAGFFSVLAEWDSRDREESSQRQETERMGND